MCETKQRSSAKKSPMQTMGRQLMNVRSNAPRLPSESERNARSVGGRAPPPIRALTVRLNCYGAAAVQRLIRSDSTGAVGLSCSRSCNLFTHTVCVDVEFHTFTVCVLFFTCFNIISKKEPHS